MNHVLKQPNKLLLILLVGLLFASCKDKTKLSGEAPCIPQSLRPNVLAIYPFTGGSIRDYSGNGHDLVNPTSAFPVSDRDGNNNCAYQFENLPSQRDYLTTDDTGFLNGLTEVSVSIWYQPLDTTRDGGMFESLLSRGTGTSCPDRMGEWSMSLYDCRNPVFSHGTSVWVLTGLGTAESCADIVTDNTGTWHHIAGTWNQSGNRVRIYKDGVLIQEESAISNCFSGPVTVNDIGDLFLGYNYHGILDDVILFNKELAPSEVASLAGLQGCCER